MRKLEKPDQAVGQRCRERLCKIAWVCVCVCERENNREERERERVRERVRERRRERERGDQIRIWIVQSCD